MINIVAKVAVGVGLVAAGTVVTAIAIDAHEANKAKELIAKAKVEEPTKVEELKKEEESRQDKSVVSKIKRYVKKKFAKFVAWVLLHMEQIEAVSAVIGLTSGAIGIVTAVKEFNRSDDTQDKLDRIELKLGALDARVVQQADKLGKYTEDCTHVTTHNMRIIDNDILELAKELGHEMPGHDEVA